VDKSLQHAYSGRKHRKRDFRALWIARVNAACRLNGVSYSQFINGLKRSGIELDRKVLAEIGADHPAAFAAIADIAKNAQG